MRRVLGLAVAVAVLGCTSAAQRAAVHVADAACEVVELATDGPIAEQLCLVEREVGDTLERVLDAQRKGATSMPLEVHSPSGVRRVKVVLLPKAEAELRRARANFAAVR